MKRAYIDLSHEQLAILLNMNDGIDISVVVEQWETGYIRFHIKGNLPEFTECQEGERSKACNLSEVMELPPNF